MTAEATDHNVVGRHCVIYFFNAYFFISNKALGYSPSSQATVLVNVLSI